MKVFIIIAALMLAAATAIASDFNRLPYPMLGNANTAIYEIGPSGNLVTRLSLTNTAVDLSAYIMYELVIPAATTTCQIRTSAVAPTVGYGTTIAVTYPGGVVVKHSVNATTPFANLSGCTGAFITMQ